jgi:alcohol dehydrogenase (cytochrome c)/quinohemoprotein ethanol dehydrogenase
MQAAANGFFYVLDRKSGVLVSAVPFVPVNWATGIDSTTGRPVENPLARYSRTRKPFVVQPGPRGAHSWHSMSFSPDTGLVYIPAQLNTAELEVTKDAATSRYAITSGTTVSHPAQVAFDTSRLIAWDPLTRSARWQLDRDAPVAGGVLATAGNLVFQGTAAGTLEALDARDGKSLWKTNTNAPVLAAPVTYEANGQQLLAVVAGAGGAALLEGGAGTPRGVTGKNTARLLVYSLTGIARVPATAAAPAQSIAAPAVGTPVQRIQGKELYAHYCARCHGADTLNTGPLKDLKRSERLADSLQWQRVVYAGLLYATGMPGFMAELKPADVEDLRAFVSGEATQISKPTASEATRH